MKICSAMCNKPYPSALVASGAQSDREFLRIGRDNHETTYKTLEKLWNCRLEERMWGRRVVSIHPILEDDRLLFPQSPALSELLSRSRQGIILNNNTRDPHASLYITNSLNIMRDKPCQQSSEFHTIYPTQPKTSCGMNISYVPRTVLHRSPAETNTNKGSHTSHWPYVPMVDLVLDPYS